MRPGELCGLRVIDLAEAEAGIIHVRHNLDSVLKEDRLGTGKSISAAGIQPHFLSSN